VWIKRSEIEKLSEYVKEFTNGQEIDVRDNNEGPFSMLKNDIYALVNKKNEQLRGAEKQRDVLSDYMADISHQLKTPITSMMIMTDLLEDADEDKRSEFIHNIKFSLNKMEWLVGTLLKMAKIDAKAVDFSKKKVRASELVTAVEPGVAILLDINNQTINLINDTEINCDKKWMTEALTNIIKNAIEHSPNDSVISIDSGDNPLYEWISIKDCGAGMSRSSYAALFKRFEYSTNENGFGIGMPLALSIVKGQGGDIDVDFGGNGQGATFTIKMYK